LSILSPAFKDAIGSSLPADQDLERMNATGLSDIDRWLERDLGVYLPNHNLLYTDKMSMACGVEARVPLLDLELVRFVTPLPASFKMKGGVTKGILREAARGTIPDEVIDRPKAGFGAPYRKWLRFDLEELWNDLTSPTVVKRRGWFDPDALARIRTDSQKGRRDLYLLQWAVLTFELWARHFLDAPPGQAG
jgi:asparagine synthase (glutamine-hydrolysing)